MGAFPGARCSPREATHPKGTGDNADAIIILQICGLRGQRMKLKLAKNRVPTPDMSELYGNSRSYFLGKRCGHLVCV